MAAVDAVCLGHDIIRLGGGEEDRHAGQVRGSGHAPDRHRRADDALLLAERTVFELCEMRVHAVPMLAVDNARRDGVDIDAIADEVQPSGLGHADHRRLGRARSEEHTSELQSLMRISYAVFCLKKTNKIIQFQYFFLHPRVKPCITHLHAKTHQTKFTRTYYYDTFSTYHYITHV